MNFLGLFLSNNFSLKFHSSEIQLSGFIGIAKSLVKTRLTLPSSKGAGKSKADEIMLPAVLLPIPGKEIQVSKS